MVCFGSFIVWFVRFTKDHCGGFEPAFVVCVVLEDAPEDMKEVVDEEVYAFNEDDVRDSVWAWGFVGFEG